MAQLSMCANECRMAMRLSGVPPLPSFGVLLGSTNVTRSSLRRRDFGFVEFGFVG